MTYSPMTAYRLPPEQPDTRTLIWRIWCQSYDISTAKLVFLASSGVGLLLGTAFILAIATMK